MQILAISTIIDIYMYISLNILFEAGPGRSRYLHNFFVNVKNYSEFGIYSSLENIHKIAINMWVMLFSSRFHVVVVAK